MGGEGKDERVCYNCKKPGHFARECPDIPAEKRVRRGPSDRSSILGPPVLGDEKGVRLSMVAGRCYRLPTREVAAVEEVELSSEAADLDVKYDPGTGQYSLRMREVRPEYYKFLIGSKAMTLQQLEKETGASITIPKTKKEEEEVGVVLRGLNERAIVDAKQRIDYIVERSRDKIPYTHFVSVPLDMDTLSPRVSDLIAKLQRYVTPETRIHSSVFQLPEKLHLTFLMLRLYTDEDIKSAVNTLRTCSKGLFELFNKTDRVHVKGIRCMNDDPSQVNVAFLGIEKGEGQQKVLDLIDLVSKEFILSRLCTSKEVEGNRRLHATIMNSKWRKEAGEEPEEEDEDLRAKKMARVPFDLSGILEDFEDVDLGEHKLMRLELSAMAERGETGYYEAVHSIAFP